MLSTGQTRIGASKEAAGNFLLTGLPAGQVLLRMDATPAHPRYPIWSNVVTLEDGKLTVLPDWVISPPLADENFPPINNAPQDQSITDERYPGVEVTLPAGVVISGWDGVIKTALPCSVRLAFLWRPGSGH